MRVVKIKHGTQEWLDYRINGIGGSDASAVLGLNPYKTNVELWEEKTGLKKPKPMSNNAAVEYGFKAEKPLVDLFKLDYPQYSVKVPKGEIYVHDNGFMFASVDGRLTKKATKELGVLEVKTSTVFASMHREKWNERIPDNYYIQVLHYMAVTNASFAVLKAQLKSVDNNGETRLITKHYFINAADVQEDIDYLVKKETEFWAHVKSKTRPNLILPNL